MSITITIDNPAYLSEREAKALSDFFMAAAKPDSERLKDKAVMTAMQYSQRPAPVPVITAVPEATYDGDSFPPPAPIGAIVEQQSSPVEQQLDRDPNTAEMFPIPSVPPAPEMSQIVVESVESSPPAVSIILDEDGLPWDARIHASTKAVNADGRWRLKRGVEVDFIKTVEAELKQAMGAPTVPPAPTVPSVPVAPPAPPAPPAPAPQATALPDAPQVTAADFFKEIGKHIARKEVTTVELNLWAQEMGLPTIANLAQRPDLIPAMREKVVEYLTSKGIAL